jgi:hypothetical protein
LKVKGPNIHYPGAKENAMRNTLKQTLLPLLAVASLLLTGCLEKETTHTLYLDADGGVTWMVLEREIRSQESDPSERQAEEREYLDLFAQGRHPVAEALRALNPDDVKTVMLRDQRPFSTMTQARFPAVDVLVRELLHQLGVTATVDYVAVGTQRHLTVRFEESDDDPPGDGEVLALIEELQSYRLVLTDGVFTSAEGFELSNDDRWAVLSEIDEEELEADGVVVLGLGWRRDAH